MLRVVKDALNIYEEARLSLMKANVKNKPITTAKSVRRENDS